MQLALRRGYGYAFDPRRGMRGLGDDTFGEVTSTDPVPITPVPVFVPNPTTLDVPTVTVPNPSTLTPPSGSFDWSGPPQGICPDGSAPFSDGSCVETSAPSGSAGSIAAAAQVAAALTKAIAPIMSATGVPSCPAGYSYGAAGQSVQIAPGVATVGAGKCLPVTGLATGQLISGISNGTLAIVGIGFLALMMLGGRRR